MQQAIRSKIFAALVMGAFLTSPVVADSAAPSAMSSVQLHDGQHDFDFNLGSWKTHIRYLRKAPDTWTEFDGTAVVRKVWDGRAQLEEIEADGATGHFEALVLFLYNPQAHQWSKVFASCSDGELGTPMVGGFSNGRGEMFDQEVHNGRTVLMRAVWSDITANSQHFEESVSDDGGKNWSLYFVAAVTRQS
jgi:hypothetical protein